jgi:hypothetical protein
LDDTSNQPTKTWIKFSSVNGSNSNGCTTSGTDNCTWQIHTKCVTERIGTHAYDDTAPVAATANTLVGKGYFSNSATSGCSVADYADPEVNLIMPMTKDKTALKARIDKLSTGGSTAGHLGTAWAYYLLSPKWNSLFPAASAAGPYSDLTVFNSKGMPKLRKIAVLMTDGDYNINYCKGTEAQNSDQSPDIKCNSENGKSQPQDRQDRGVRGRLPGELGSEDVPDQLRHRRQPLLRRHHRRGAAGGLPRHRAQDRDAQADELTLYRLQDGEGVAAIGCPFLFQLNWSGETLSRRG